MTITTINPTNGKLLEKYSTHTPEEVIEIVAKADSEFKNWRKTSVTHRSKLMLNTAKILKGQVQFYAEIITREMGKTISSARAEVEKCAWVCEYYAENSGSFLATETIITDASHSFIAYQPIGVVLAVMPWNFPFWQVFRFAAPALMAGNAGVLKHASNVPACALAIQEIFEKAGFTKGLFSTLLIPGKEVESVINNPKIKAVTFTGSGEAGSAVATVAGRNIKKTVLELGGNDAFLILEDADLELAAETCVRSRLFNTGQSCIGAKRLVVVNQIYDAFLKLFIPKMKAAKMGNPMDKTTNFGPMARKDLRQELHNQVLESIEKGANCILGGEITDSDGAYYPATILTEVKPNMPAYENELFGPVASIIRAKDEADAIRIANDSLFGLGAAVFTRDKKRGEQIATFELEAGACFVNELVKSDPRLPFGGIKLSGYGRELAHYGIREFVNVKTIWVK